MIESAHSGRGLVLVGESRRLPRSFYEQPVVNVARAAIGMVLVHLTPEGEVAGRIDYDYASLGLNPEAMRERFS